MRKSGKLRELSKATWKLSTRNSFSSPLEQRDKPPERYGLLQQNICIPKHATADTSYPTLIHQRYIDDCPTVFSPHIVATVSTSWPSLSPATSSPPPQASYRRTHLTTTHHGHKQKAKGRDLGVVRCIGRESNPGLAESSEIRDLIWQRPILPLNHQCWRWKRLLWLVFVYAAPNWQHPHVR
jgi:hypothetical protein